MTFKDYKEGDKIIVVDFLDYEECEEEVCDYYKRQIGKKFKVLEVDTSESESHPVCIDCPPSSGDGYKSWWRYAELELVGSMVWRKLCK
jgi:hypothetical protein